MSRCYRHIVYVVLLLLCSQVVSAQAMTCGEFRKLDEMRLEAFYQDDEALEMRLEEEINRVLMAGDLVPLTKRFYQLRSKWRMQRRELAPHGRAIGSVDVTIALSNVCKSHEDDPVSIHYRQELTKAIQSMEERTGYLASIKGTLELFKSIPEGERRPIHELPHGRLCNRRDDTAYVSIASYAPHLKLFVARGWQQLSPNRCMEVGEHQYSFISWDDRTARATPPRRYSKVPSAHFCLKKGEDFTFYHADRTDFCQRTQGVMKTFLKHGLESENLE